MKTNNEPAAQPLVQLQPMASQAPCNCPSPDANHENENLAFSEAESAYRVVQISERDLSVIHQACEQTDGKGDAADCAPLPEDAPC